MNRLAAVQTLRARLRDGGATIGSWMQLPHASVAEIMGQAGYEWVALDLEHGALALHQLPDLCRALELGKTLPLVRLAQGDARECKQTLDAGAAGVIVPMIESAAQLAAVRDSCRWPPAGNRGVGFSRANLFGKHFDLYREEAQAPLLVAMIEHIRAVENLETILEVPGLDAILVGPYDLSASIGMTGQLNAPELNNLLERVRTVADGKGMPCGVHIVAPDPAELARCLRQGYRFLAYSIDAVFLNSAAARPTVQLPTR